MRWTERHIALFGTTPGREVAEKIGCSQALVAANRIELEIAPLGGVDKTAVQAIVQRDDKAVTFKPDRLDGEALRGNILRTVDKDSTLYTDSSNPSAGLGWAYRHETEQEFRFNVRKMSEAARFLALLRGVVGKRLTYRRLCAIGDSGFMDLK